MSTSTTSKRIINDGLLVPFLGLVAVILCAILVYFTWYYVPTAPPANSSTALSQAQREAVVDDFSKTIPQIPVNEREQAVNAYSTQIATSGTSTVGDRANTVDSFSQSISASSTGTQ